MDKNKLKIICIAFIIIGFISIFVIFYSNMIMQNNNHDNDSTPSVKPNTTENNLDYIIIDNNTIWQVVNNNFREIDSVVTDDLFNTYVNSNYYGQYNLKYGNVWNLFSLGKYVSYNGNLFANTTHNLNINLKKIDSVLKIDINDYDEIYQEMKTNINDDDLNINEKVKIDIDQNGQIDEIISVSNIKIGEDNIQEKKIYYNLLYVNFNGQKINLINNIVDIKDLLIVPSYHIAYVLDINSIPSIIIQEIYYSEGGIRNILYQYENGEFVRKII